VYLRSIVSILMTQEAMIYQAAIPLVGASLPVGVAS
jgi:hypothetical protein